MRRRFVLVLALAGLAATLAVGRARAQAPRPQDPDVLNALLVEVRGLRAAMEQIAGAGPRVQLALGRLQLQEQRINTTNRRLETVRASLLSAERDMRGLQQEAADLEEALKHATGEPEERVEQRRSRLADYKRGFASRSAEVDRLRAEVALLEQQGATEQGQWSDINRLLEELDRSLARR